MRPRKFLGAILSVAVLLGATAPAADSAEKGGLDETGPYDVVPNWFKPGIVWDQPVGSVVVDTPNRIIIGNADERTTRPNAWVIGPGGQYMPERSKMASKPDAEKSHLHMIMVLNQDGKAIEDWKQWDELIATPHSLHISPYDKDRHVWLVDREGQQILKFTNDGKKLALRIGEKGVPGNDKTHFNRPSALTFMPDGSFYVADGYTNTRIVKFDANGKYQFEWGKKGTGPGEFNLVHYVAVDAQKRVYVADRSNNRIQIFDENGKYLDQWPNIRGPVRLLISQDQSLWLTSQTNRVAKFDLNGVLQTTWGVRGDWPGAMDNPHALAVDANGAIYIPDMWNNRIQKFVPRKDADKSRLIQPEFVLKTP